VSRYTKLAVGTVLLLGIACSSPSSNPDTSKPVPGSESVAYKLAVIGGDANDEAAFQDVIDCILASGIEGAETEEKVGDTLYASWRQSSQSDSLLEWAQAFC
jgi:hypothetical protein